MLRALARWFAVLLLLVAGGLVAPGQASATVSSAPPVSNAPWWRFTQGRTPPAQLKIMNYYPADAGWTLMWTSYSHARTDADFAALADLGANTVRVIVAPEAVGWPTLSATGAAEFRDTIDTAARHGLGVEVTLFDLWYSWEQIEPSKAWLTQLLGPYAGDNRIALVELQNELPTSYAPALTWAKALLPELATVLPGVPRSLSAASAASLRALAAAIPPADLDVVDVHLYGATSAMPATLALARSLAAGRPVLIGETGVSTAAAAGGSDAAQTAFYRTMTTLARQAGVSYYAPWIYSDFVPAAMPGWLQTPAEENFGLRRLDGSYKPAADVVRAMFAARPLGGSPAQCRQVCSTQSR